MEHLSVAQIRLSSNKIRGYGLDRKYFSYGGWHEYLLDEYRIN